jgi:hypothetical protein
MSDRLQVGGYRAVPIAEMSGDAGWRAGVLLHVDDPRGERTAKSLGASLFPSREEALQFAESEFGTLGAAPGDGEPGFGAG